ncbi:MAG: mechanosensitive channel protein [Gammaproteobacteria bacterium]
MMKDAAAPTLSAPLRILLVCLSIALTTGAPSLAAAQAQEQESQAGDNRTDAALPLHQLADLLENDEARAQIVTQLRDAAASRRGDAPPAPALSEETAGAATAAAAEEPQQPSFARRLAATTAGWAEVIGAQMTALGDLARATFDQDRGTGLQFDRRTFVAALTTFALVAAATIAAYLALRLLAVPLFAAVGRFSARAESGFGVVIRRGTAVILALAVDVGVVLLAYGAGYFVALFVVGSEGTMGTRESLLINAFALVELTKVAIRTVFSARHENLRLINVSTPIAIWWSTRLSWFVSVIGYGVMVLVPIVNVQISPFAGALTRFLIMGAAYVYALAVIFRNRSLFSARIENLAENATAALFGVLFRLMARLWVLLAVAYFTTLFVLSQLDPAAALPFMLSATLQTLLTAAIGFGLSGLLSTVIGKRITFSEDIRARLPMLEARVNAYVPNALKFIRMVILVIATLVIVDAWQLFDLGAWLASDIGLQTASTLTRVALIVLVAAMLWIVAASLIEHRLNPNTGGGRPSARQETLLELFRNALAIVIVTMTAMIVLSQIGVNIGPLIAGAGVLGLAIGFGAQKLVQDIITGVFIQLENAMNTGDVVTVGGITGTAERLSIRSVGIRDLDGAYHIVPFSAADTVTNYMREFAFFRTEYGIAYREDIDNAIHHLREAFAELKQDSNVSENIIEDMTVPGVTALADSSVNIRIMIKTKPGTQWGVGRAFNRLVKMHFDRAGIEIPFPHQTLYFGEDREGKAPPANVRVLATDQT